MLTFNRNEAHEIITEAARHTKPKYNITVIPSQSLPQRPHQPPKSVLAGTGPPSITKAQVKEEAQDKFNNLRLEQAKLSNTIFDEVERGASTAELAALYEKIENFRPDLVDSYNRTRSGRPADQEPSAEEKPAVISADILSLRDQKRKLIDKRFKLGNKIKIGNPAKIQEWQLELDRANVEYASVDDQIKKLSGK